MAVESAQMADLDKMAAPKPAASVSPRKVRRPDPPKYFKGCKCLKTKCKNSHCPCCKNDYPCTWKCECRECGNTSGDKGSDPNTGPGSSCKCTLSSCLSKNCQCVKPSSGIEPEQVDTSNMAVESAQMADLDKMAAPKPPASVSPRKVRRPDPPKYFKGCKCLKTKCKNSHCPCCKNDYPCTWKCECRECGNTSGDKGSDPNTGPGSSCKCTLSSCLSKNCQCVKPSSGIEPEQADPSSMAVESAQMADLNNMAAQKPAAPVSPGKVRRQVPENFKGCKCPTWRCKKGNCPCYAASYPCTWKCECVECDNSCGKRGSDSNTGPVTWCKCTVTRCMGKRCRCLKVSQRCNFRCECGNCANQDGVRGSEPDEAVHITPPSNIESEQPDFINSWVTELMQAGLDPNKGPPTK